MAEQSSTLRHLLADWTDVDGAQYCLGLALGYYGAADDFGQHKGTFWTKSPLGDGLYAALLALVDANMLEKRDEPDIQFRWARGGISTESALIGGS